MIELSTLIAALTLDNEQYRKALGESIDEGQSVVDQLGNLGGGIMTGIGVGALTAVAGGVVLLEQAAEEAMAAEEVTAKLNATLANTGDVTGVTAGMVDELANKYQGLTKYEDDNIKAGGEVLARFDEINKDAFPDALRLSLDLAERLGMDVPNAAELLGKALADPGVGLMKLKAAGVVFTDQQEEMINKMMESGDQAGAMALIMDTVNETVGGAAEAAGNTASGMWQRLKNQWGNILELIGTGLLPLIMQLGQGLMEYLNRPQVVAFIDKLAKSVAWLARIVGMFFRDLASGNLIDFFTAAEDGTSAMQGILEAFGMSEDVAMQWADKINTAMQWVINSFSWLVTQFQTNQGLVVAVLAVIGAAIAAWVYTVVIPAAVAAITAMAPILLVMAAIALVAYLVYEAWTNNWGGIRDTLTTLWEGTLKPALTQLVQWLKVNIPLALKALSAFWTNTLLPAIQQVWSFLQTYIFPLFQAVAKVIQAVFGLALKVVAGYAQNILIPALRSLWNWIEKNILPAVSKLANWLSSKLKPAFAAITDAISKVINWLMSLQSWLNGLTLPSWLTPGSPTPWEIGLWGIYDALRAVARGGLPPFEAALALSPVAPAALGVDLAPRAFSVSTATESTGARDADLQALLRDVRRALNDLPREIARTTRDATLRVSR